MALGVSDALPLAMFVHATKVSDIKPHHLEDQDTVVLVDSVINTGKTIMDFVKHIKSLDQEIRIVVITGVAQSESLELGGTLRRTLARYG